MRSHKLIPLIVALTLAGSVAVSACTPAAGPAEQPGATSDGTITVWTATAGVALAQMKKFGTEFGTEHHVKVEILASDDAGLKQKVQAATTSGAFPDIVQYFGGSFMAPLVAANAFRPLDDFVAASPEWKAQMVDSWAENYTFDGKVYAVPFESPLVQLFYNRSVLSKAGVGAPPATFDDLLDDVATLKKAGYTPIAVDGKDGWPMQQWFAYLVMRNGGTQAIHDAVAGRLAWDSPVFLTSAQQLKQLIDAGAFQPGFLGEDYNQMLARYTSGKAGMLLNGSWLLNSIVSADNADLINQTSYTAFPTTSGGAGSAREVQGGPNGSLAIARVSPDAELSWEFIKGFTSSEVATTVAEKSLSLVPNKIAVSGSDLPPVFTTMVADLPTYTGFNIFWNEILTPEFNTEFTNRQNEMIAGKITPQEMVTKLADYAAKK